MAKSVKNKLAGAIATGIVQAATKMNSPVNEVASKASGKRPIDKWEAEDGLRTLQRAGEIQKNKPLMKEIKKVAKAQVETASKFCK